VPQPLDHDHSDESRDPADAPLFDSDGALSRAFLIRRGFCCQLGCKNCPYDGDGRERAKLTPP
jgi:hypothetical protein